MPLVQVVVELITARGISLLADFLGIMLLTERPQFFAEIANCDIPKVERTVPVAFFGALLFAFGGFPCAVFVVPLRQQREQIQHEFTLWGSGVQPGFRHGYQPNTRFFEPRNIAHHIGQAATEAIQFMDDNYIKLFGFGAAHHALEFGAQISLGRAAWFFENLEQVPAAQAS
jgi:hypothetical protein